MILSFNPVMKYNTCMYLYCLIGAVHSTTFQDPDIKWYSNLGPEESHNTYRDLQIVCICATPRAEPPPIKSPWDLLLVLQISIQPKIKII